MGTEEKPWFGKRCLKCEAPLNYAQASKALVPGLCGKCIDETRKGLKDELRRELANENAVVLSRGGGAGGGAKLVIGLVLGLVVGAGASVATAAFAPELWGRVVGAVAPPPKAR